MSDFFEYIPSCGKSVLWLSLSSSLYFLGESPECPECGEKDLSCRLSVAESLLPAELEGGPRPCPFKVILYSDLKSLENPSVGRTLVALFGPIWQHFYNLKSIVQLHLSNGSS